MASRRGSQNIKGGPSASETTFLQSAVKQHMWVQHEVASATMPGKSVTAGILKMSGTKSSNQHSNDDT